MVVRMRKTRSKTRSGRSHLGIKEPELSTCSHCGDLHRPHHMCLSCGYYKGRQVIDLEAERAKRDARIKAKEERIKGEQAGASEAPADVTEQGATDDIKEEMKKKDSDEGRAEDARKEQG